MCGLIAIAIAAFCIIKLGTIGWVIGVIILWFLFGGVRK